MPQSLGYTHKRGQHRRDPRSIIYIKPHIQTYIYIHTTVHIYMYTYTSKQKHRQYEMQTTSTALKSLHLLKHSFHVGNCKKVQTVVQQSTQLSLENPTHAGHILVRNKSQSPQQVDVVDCRSTRPTEGAFQAREEFLQEVPPVQLEFEGAAALS